MLLYFALALAVSLLIQIGFFIFAAKYKTDKFTDLSYGLTFIILASLYFFYSERNLAQTIVTLMVVIWGIRLAYFLFQRILKTGKDKRFDGIRENFSRFLKFWIFQGVVVWIVLLPTLQILYKPSSNNFYLFLGFAIWLAGFSIEAIADHQKRIFRNSNLKNTFISSGLWKYSRHPNYLGEIILWWGIFIVSIPAQAGLSVLTVVGPLTITYLLLFVTGIPPLEKSADDKFGNDPKYREYKKRTSILVPFVK